MARAIPARIVVTVRMTALALTVPPVAMEYVSPAKIVAIAHLTVAAGYVADAGAGTAAMDLLVMLGLDQIQSTATTRVVLAMDSSAAPLSPSTAAETMHVRVARTSSTALWIAIFEVDIDR